MAGGDFRVLRVDRDTFQAIVHQYAADNEEMFNRQIAAAVDAFADRLCREHGRPLSNVERAHLDRLRADLALVLQGGELYTREELARKDRPRPPTGAPGPFLVLVPEESQAMTFNALALDCARSFLRTHYPTMYHQAHEAENGMARLCLTDDACKILGYLARYGVAE